MIDKLAKLAKREWANLSFSKKLNVQPPHPIVSFTFDDAPVSAFEHGADILAKHGFGGTFYISLSLMNGPEADTRFTSTHLRKALARNNELGCHTYGHIDLAQTKTQEGIADIKRNQETLHKLLPGLEFKNFSYPFGAQTRLIKKFASEHFRTARGIEEGLNVGTTDACNLKTVKLYESKHTLDYISQKISEAQKSNAWLIFYTHDVTDKYSVWGCSPAYFEAVVQECAQRGITVSTINEALNLIESTRHES